jgi:plasmid stabilization system protein ParE
VDCRILYSQRSLNDLSDFLWRTAKEDAEAASRFGTSILDHIDLLASFPRLGAAILKRLGVRKLIHTPLFVYYRIREDGRIIEILHIRHGARTEAVLAS